MVPGRSCGPIWGDVRPEVWSEVTRFSPIFGECYLPWQYLGWHGCKWERKLASAKIDWIVKQTVSLKLKHLRLYTCNACRSLLLDVVFSPSLLNWVQSWSRHIAGHLVLYAMLFRAWTEWFRKKKENYGGSEKPLPTLVKEKEPLGIGYRKTPPQEKKIKVAKCFPKTFLANLESTNLFTLKQSTSS